MERDVSLNDLSLDAEDRSRHLQLLEDELTENKNLAQEHATLVDELRSSIAQLEIESRMIAEVNGSLSIENG